jgi:hypothetical protein
MALEAGARGLTRSDRTKTKVSRGSTIRGSSRLLVSHEKPDSVYYCLRENAIKPNPT